MGGVHEEFEAVEQFMLNFFRELFELLVSIDCDLNHGRKF
jgi:hypothetical protein